MPIGTSLGGFFKDKMDFHLGIDQYDTEDQNEVSPDRMMENRHNDSDPHNVYDDQGNIVDYRDPMLSDESNSILKEMTKPLAPQQVPPDDYHSLLQQNKFQQTDPIDVIPIADIKTSSPLVTITDEDINKGISLGTGFAGGGLSTALSNAERVGPAALNIKGKIYTGSNHGQAFEKFMTENPQGDYSNFKDGFMTTHGRFVSREEAFDLAKKNDQVDPQVLKSLPKDQEGSMLLSEDLMAPTP